MSSIAAGAFAAGFNFYAVSAGISEDRLGFVLAVSSLADALCAVPISLAARFVGYRTGFLLMLLVTGFSQLARAATTNTSVMMMAAFIGGAGAAGDFVLRLPFVAEQSSEENRAMLFSLSGFVSSAANAVGTLAAGHLPGLGPLRRMDRYLSYRYTLFAAAFLSIAAALPVWLMKPVTAHSQEKSILSWRPDGRQTRIAALFLLRGLSMGLSLSFLNLYFVNHLGTSTEYYSNLAALTIFPIMVGAILGPRVSTRCGIVRTITALRVGIAFPIIVMAVTGNALVAGLSNWLVRAMFAAESSLSFAHAMSTPALEARASTAAVLHVSQVVGNSIAVSLGGAFLARGDYTSPFLIGAGLMWICAFFTAFLFGKPPNQPLCGAQ